MSKIIRHYSEFLKHRLFESNIIRLEKRLWPLDYEDFQDYLYGFLDEDVVITFEKSLLANKKMQVGLSYKEKYEDVKIITDCLSLDGQKSLYRVIVKLESIRDISLSELLANLKLLANGASDEFELEYYLSDDNGNKIDFEDINIDDNGNIRVLDYDVDELIVCFHTIDDIKVDGGDLIDYYGWGRYKMDDSGSEVNSYKIIDGDLYVRKTQQNMEFVARNSDDYDSVKLLLNPIEDIHEWESEIDNSSLFMYHLNIDAIKLIIKRIIKESGGLEEFILEFEYDTELDLNDKSEEDVINLISNERFNNTLLEISKDVEFVEEIRRDFDSWDAQSRVDKFEENLQNDFDEILSESFSFIKDKYRTEFKNVGKEWCNYFFYWIKVESKLIDDLYIYAEYEKKDISFTGLSHLFSEWFETRGPGAQRLDTRDPLTGDVDTDEFSNEIIALYLSDT